MLSLWRDSLAFRVAVFIGLIFLLLVVAPWVYLDWRTSRDLEVELQRIREAGEPLTLAEAAPEPVPPSENAAEPYQQALGRMGPQSTSMGTSLFESSGHSDLIVDGYLYGNAPHRDARRAFDDPKVVRALDLLRRGSEREECVFPVNWEDGYGALFPHFARLRSAARWLSAKSKLCAHDGEIDEALDWCCVSLRMAEHTAQEPTLIGELVAIAIQAIALQRAEQVMQEGPPSPQFARETIEDLRSIDMREPFRNALLGERATGLETFDTVRRESPEDLFNGLLGGSGASEPNAYQLLAALYGTPLGRPLLSSDQIIYLQMMRRRIELVENAAPKDRERLAEDVEENVPQMAIISRILVPVFARAVQKRDDAIARLDVFEIALAAEIFHAERGEWPFDLQQLQDTLSYELPQDPFAQGPYHYRREKDGFVVWGLGKDSDDDGGHGPRDPGYNWDNYDIVWKVKR